MIFIGGCLATNSNKDIEWIGKINPTPPAGYVIKTSTTVRTDPASPMRESYGIDAFSGANQWIILLTRLTYSENNKAQNIIVDAKIIQNVSNNLKIYTDFCGYKEQWPSDSKSEKPFVSGIIAIGDLNKDRSFNDTLLWAASIDAVKGKLNVLDPTKEVCMNISLSDGG